MRDRNAARVGGILQLIAAVTNRLRPADRRGVLGADPAAAGQHRRAAAAGHVEDDTDIPTAAHGVGARKRSCCRILDV